MDKISALMDGELARDEAAHLVAEIRQRGGLREAWATYHLIGDALRGEPCVDCGVLQSVAKELVKEPTVLAPRRIGGEIGRRWALPSLAAAAAVASVTWVAMETLQGEMVQPTATPASHLVVPAVDVRSPSISLSEYTQPVHASPQTPVPIQISARQFDAYLMAHQEFSPSTMLQGLAPYVRTVTSGAVETGR
ncbi:MAG: sigma-E factor negative regulatory protein [Burkholderiales bacterium]|nr:sigma-E factor negative regulatory protein [Burkholderiales bacterium]